MDRSKAKINETLLQKQTRYALCVFHVFGSQNPFLDDKNTSKNTKITLFAFYELVNVKISASASRGKAVAGVGICVCISATVLMKDEVRRDAKHFQSLSKLARMSLDNSDRIASKLSRSCCRIGGSVGWKSKSRKA